MHRIADTGLSRAEPLAHAALAFRISTRSPQRATLELWERLGGYDVAISELTLTEARATGDAALRKRMVNLVDDFLVLPVGEEARQLAREYVGRGVSPQRQPWTRSTWRLRLPPARICS